LERVRPRLAQVNLAAVGLYDEFQYGLIPQNLFRSLEGVVGQNARLILEGVDGSVRLFRD
jgi:hypothetical protein